MSLPSRWPAFVRAVTQSGIEPEARSTGSMPQAVRFFTKRITALNDESRHDPKGRAVVKLHFYEIDEVFDVTRSILRIEANLDLAELRRDRHTGIDFFEFHHRESNRVRSGRQGGQMDGGQRDGDPAPMRARSTTWVTIFQIDPVSLSLDQSSAKEPRRSTQCLRLWQRNRPAPLCGDPRRETWRNCSPKIGTRVHEA